VSDHNLVNQHPQPSKDWCPFVERLAEALSVMEEDQYLILSSKSDNRYVQFSAQGSFGMRAETVSNTYLDDAHRHSDEDLLILRSFGWNDPTSGPGVPPTADPDGSPNHYREWAAPVNHANVAFTAVRTLIEVLDIPSPGWLQYAAFDSDDHQILIPSLGLKREPAA